MKKSDYIDLLLDYLDGKLDKELADDIKNTLPNDPVLNTTVEGLAELYEEHGHDREALRQYFKDTEEEITSSLEKKVKENKRTKHRRILIFFLVVLGTLATIYWINKQNTVSKSDIEETSSPEVIPDTLDNKEEKSNPPQKDNQRNERVLPKKTDDNKIEKIDSINNLNNSVDKKDVFALNLKGGFTPIDIFDKEIGVILKNSNEKLLINTKDRDIIPINKSDPIIQKTFQFNKKINLSGYQIEFLDKDAYDNERSEVFQIEEHTTSFTFQVNEGLFYWIISKNGKDIIYGSILVKYQN